VDKGKTAVAVLKGRRTISWFALAAVVGVWAPAAFGQDMSKVTNTPHNLNNLDVWGIVIPDSRVCLPCHTPHNARAETPGQEMVLWNHAVTEQTFEMYTTLAEHEGGQPEGASKLCLSCHDGVTAIDSYGSNSGTVTMPPWRPTFIGTDLTNDHPIGIQYPPPDDLPGYHDKTTFTGVRVVTIGGVDRVECTSCHDPHNNSLGGFLRQTMDGSALCMECHDK
jgi:predicted CXXCH cytochrome family protein